MKRMHIHVGVENLDEAVAFYGALFGAEPAKHKSDYAKWMLDDPCVNFAVSTRSADSGRSAATGLEHLGIQVDDEAELGALRARLEAADMSLVDEGETVCCYARSDKSWVQDPAGIAWEAYRTMDEAQYFSADDAPGEDSANAPERGPEAAGAATQSLGGCCG